MAASPAMEKLHDTVAISAIYDGERDEKDDYTGVCHPGTREEYLENLQAWADNAPPDMRVEWVNAIAGAGKTAMLRTFCTLLEERGPPPVSFFIWKGDAKRNTLKHFPATIAYQLCQTFQVLIPLIEKAINASPLLLQSAFKKQMEKLVIGPLLDACNTIKEERHIIIVVDGLDELDTKGQTEFLNFIPYLLSRLSSLPISLLVSSRPDAQIVGAFNHPKLASITRATRLGASDPDIRKFLEDKFEDINLRHPYLRIEHGIDGKWPGDEKLEIMVTQSSGLFIWPTVAIGHIDKVEKGLGHNARLDQVLSSAEKLWVGSPLDNLYRTILEAHAPEDRTSFAFFRFKRRLALFCILDLTIFVLIVESQVLDWSDIPVRIVFDETLDELWRSVAGLSSLFLPRKPPSYEDSPIPRISHRSLRDFTFNRERCGEELYYSSERELHAEVVCKIIKFFNTRQAYQSDAGMSAEFINRAHNLLQSHLDDAAVSGELGCCMDDIVLDYIPPTWPLVAQIDAIVNLFGGLYEVAENPEFVEGSRRREALLSKVTAFFRSRAANAQEWDVALFRLALSTANFEHDFVNIHSGHCWRIARSAQCRCIDAYMRNTNLQTYQAVLDYSTLFQHARARLVEQRQVDIGHNSLTALRFFLSLSETSQRAAELSPFIRVRNDYWIIVLLRHCPPNDDLYNSLGPICTAPLPDLPKGKEDGSCELISEFLWQTKQCNAYTKRCREVGIETRFPPTKIPDDWWEDEETRRLLLTFDYKPPFDIPGDWWTDGNTRYTLFNQGFEPLFDIPEDWWEDEGTRFALLDQGRKPSFNIPEEWWEDERTRCSLLKQGLEPPSNILEEWWEDKETRQILRSRGYPPPDPYSVEETASEGEDDLPEDEESDTEELCTDQHASSQGEPLPDGETLSKVASPPTLAPPLPVVALSDPIQTQPVAPVHSTISPAGRVENCQAGPSNAVAGRQRRGFRNALKNIFCW